MFEEEAVAELMLAHTDGEPRARHAVLAANMRGGGGFEIWQHKGKKPEPIAFDIHLGDLGINIGKIKSDNVKAAYEKFQKSGLNLLGPVQKDPVGNNHFYMKDAYGNMWEIKNVNEVFKWSMATQASCYPA